MTKYENQCVDCPSEMGCTRPHCKNWHVPIWVCDECGDENVDLWEYEGQELCKCCLLNKVHMAHHE